MTVPIEELYGALAVADATAIAGITFDKPMYHQGDTITATVAYTVNPFTFTAQTADGQKAIGSFIVLPKWTVTDTGLRTWTMVSDDGQKAIFTAVA